MLATPYLMGVITYVSIPESVTNRPEHAPVTVNKAAITFFSAQFIYFFNS
jgi:hypothetical protein